jgi:hypothetical protein
MILESRLGTLNRRNSREGGEGSEGSEGATLFPSPPSRENPRLAFCGSWKSRPD